MSKVKDHDLDYQGTILLKDNLGLQEVYSSRNYDTFYSIYLTLTCQVDPDDADKIWLKDMKNKDPNRTRK